MSESENLPTSRDLVVNVFDGFRAELDDHNDRRERLIKSSRDITNLSKKVIFLLHRIVTDASESEHDDQARTLRAASRAREKLKEIQGLFAAFREEIKEDRFWRYQKNVSPGLQEYIEALSFTHYIETGTLITYGEVQASISDDAGNPYLPLPLEDYLLGLSDLTGELMRYAISAISRRGGRTKANEVCTFVRDFRATFENFTPHFRELRKKQKVTSQSLEKIEDVAYAIAVRTSEYDLPPEMLDDLVAGYLPTSHRGGGDSKRTRVRDDDYDAGDLED